MVNIVILNEGRPSQADRSEGSFKANIEDISRVIADPKDPIVERSFVVSADWRILLRMTSVYNSTLTFSLSAASAISKNSNLVNFKLPAIILFGKDSILVLKSRTWPL